MVNLYVCNQIGTGTKADPYRPAIAALDVAWDRGGTEWYDGIDHPARRFWLGIVYGSDATHDLCETVATPLLTRQDEALSLTDALEELWDNKPVDWKTARVSIMETFGTSMAWLNGTTRLRNVLRYIMIHCFFAQEAEGEGNSNMINFLARNLDTTMSQLSTAVRQAGRDWLTAHGLTTNWITNQTTVRQVVHYVLQNLPFGTIRFYGQDY